MHWKFFLHQGVCHCQTRESLLKGKYQYNRPPCLDKLLLILKMFFFLFYKTSYHKEEVNRSEPSPSVRVLSGLV